MTPTAEARAAQIVATWIGQMTEVGWRRLTWGSVTDKDDLIIAIAAGLTTHTAALTSENYQLGRLLKGGCAEIERLTQEPPKQSPPTASHRGQ